MVVEADISNFQKETQGGTFEIEWECCVLLMLSMDVGGEGVLREVFTVAGWPRESGRLMAVQQAEKER